MKKLPSSLREKKRYVAFRIHCDEHLNREEVVRAIWKEMLSFLGENSASELNLWIMDFDAATKQGFLVCRHTKVGHIQAGLTLISEINNKKACINVLGVSGTINALRRKFLNKEFIVNEEDKEISFYDKGMKVVLSHGNCFDAFPLDEELKLRLKCLKIKFVGLTKQDLEV
jgi:ribonuclease P/MRP protein subunit POP5